VRITLTEAIKAEAHRLGFELAGVTTPEPPAHYRAFERWLELGRHGEMGYLAKENACQRRADPRQILPECRSVLVLGMRYPAAGAVSVPDQEGEPRGRVAAYAWGVDYHDILPTRLQALAAFIEQQVQQPVPYRIYTDTGPVLERDLAQRAGLGWIGKNTCLINPRQGSYFLLAEILLGIELEPDAPIETDHCGRCRRCIDACPTHCILPDRTLDARRCISYLTIELKGGIPIELRAEIGDWIFGCDVCQQVCPWNLRFGRGDGNPELAPRPENQRPRLVSEMGLTPQVFNQQFRGSPVQRARRRGYLRNVATALGNSGSAAALPPLATALLNDPEALVRQHAAWALGRLGGKAQLLAALTRETDDAVRSEIRLALAKLA
jgi:epoxyqueuosine reductase